MKLKFIRNTVAGQKPVKIGDIVDLPDSEARRLVLMGRAVEVKHEQPAEAAPVEAAEVPQKPADEAPAKPSKPSKKKGL